MSSKSDGRIDAEIVGALRHLAQVSQPRVFAEGAVWEVSRRFFRSGRLDEAKLHFLRAVLRCYGQAYLVLGDYDRGVERDLVQLGATAAALKGAWMITSDIEIVHLDRASLYLGNWHLFTTAESPVTAHLMISGDMMEPGHLANMVGRNAISAMVVADADDDRWLLSWEGLEQVSLHNL